MQLHFFIYFFEPFLDSSWPPWNANDNYNFDVTIPDISVKDQTVSSSSTSRSKKWPVSKSESSQTNQIEEKDKLDANKRKILPAWIRDGLEKMEKEKLKNVVKEKRDVKYTETQLPDNLYKNILQESVAPIKSKFVSFKIFY